MFGFGKKKGVSFSISRLIGLAGFKTSIAKKTGIPTTKEGLFRKVGRFALKIIFGK